MLLVTSCTKQRNRTLTVEGTLMANCSTPAVNTSGYFHYTGGMKRYTWAEFTTDANGYFKVTEKIGGSNLGMTIGKNNQVLREITLKGNDYLDLGKVYINHFPTNFIIKLDVKKPYTENDTLFIKDYWDVQISAKWKAISGPFESGSLDSITDTWSMFPITWWEIIKYGGAFNRVVANFKNSETNQRESKSVAFFTAPICSGEYAQVTLVIE
jgi:hypothetical protein